MSRLEAGGLVPEPRVFAVAEALDPLASEFRALAADRGLAFHYVASDAWVRSDPPLLRRVLQNLLANAVRYTPRGAVPPGVRRQQGSPRLGVGPAAGRDREGEELEPLWCALHLQQTQ